MRPRIPFAILLLPALALAQSTRPATTTSDSAEQTLKDKGLTRVGTTYVLPGDPGSADQARAAAKAKIVMDDTAKKRTTYEADIRRAESAAANWERQYRDLNERYTRAGSDEAKNQLAAQVNAIASNIREAARFVEQRQKDLDALPDRRDDYMTAVIQGTSAMEETQHTYETLLADPDVVSALAAVNTDSRFRFHLGPTPAFTQRLELMRKQRGTIDDAVVKLELHGGVPTAMVTVNGKVTRRMVVDSGASLVSLSADTAKQLAITPGPDAPVVHMIIANGQRVDAHLVMLKSVQLGRFTANDVECAVLPPSQLTADNLLGGSFLKHFIYRMDLAAGELHLTNLTPVPPSAILAPKPVSAAPATQPASRDH